MGCPEPRARHGEVCSASRSRRCGTTSTTLELHTGDFINQAQHTYRADPGGWLIVARPIGIDAVNSSSQEPWLHWARKLHSSDHGCGRLRSGGLSVFRTGAAAILWIGGRDCFRHSGRRRAEQLVAVVCFQSRPRFFFYAISIIPFSVMAIALCAGWILGDARPATAVWSVPLSSGHSLLWWPPTLPTSIPFSPTNSCLSPVAVAHVVSTWIEFEFSIHDHRNRLRRSPL